MNGSDSERQGEIFILVGEVSADLHASGLLREFHQLQPHFHFFGTGGDRLTEQGCELLYHIRDISFLGFAEVLRHLPFIWRMMQHLLEECQRRQPRAIILVDYPGFNLRFAARLKKHPATRHIPILYYISPQVWAWHASRVPAIARLVDRLAVIFDFEVPIYQRAGLQVDFVGHPLLEVVRPTQSRDAFRQALGLQLDDLLCALAPGSRQQEVSRLFPLFLQTYQRLRQNFPSLKAVVGCSPTLPRDFYEGRLKLQGLDPAEVVLVENQTYDALAFSNVALVASGTVTLETAILGTPMVMAYRVAPLTYWLGRILVTIPNIALVNVVAGKRVVPEFVQHAATPRSLAAALAELFRSPEKRQQMIRELEKVKSRLGEPGGSRRVANLLAELISQASARV